eukprot:4290272-Amphidinium_carterae.1
MPAHLGVQATSLLEQMLVVDFRRSTLCDIWQLKLNRCGELVLGSHCTFRSACGVLSAWFRPLSCRAQTQNDVRKIKAQGQVTTATTMMTTTMLDDVDSGDDDADDEEFQTKYYLLTAVVEGTSKRLRAFKNSVRLETQ